MPDPREFQGVSFRKNRGRRVQDTDDHRAMIDDDDYDEDDGFVVPDDEDIE